MNNTTIFFLLFCVTLGQVMEVRSDWMSTLKGEMSPSSPTKLIVEWYGTAVLDSPIHFCARLENPTRSDYTISWLEGPPYGRIKTEDHINATNNFTTDWTLTYWSNNESNGGNYSVTTSAYFYNIFYFNVDTKVTLCEITNNFVGTLEVWQEGHLVKNPVVISTLKETTLKVHVDDPSNFLGMCDHLVYSWYSMTSSPQNFLSNTTTPWLKFNFTRPGDYQFMVNLYAQLNASSGLNTGHFWTNVTVRDTSTGDKGGVPVTDVAGILFLFAIFGIVYCLANRESDD